MDIFKIQRNENETLVSKAVFSKSRNAALILGIVILLGTFLYSWNWSASMGLTFSEGFHYTYFNPFLVGIAIFSIMIAVHLLFCSCKLELTQSRIIGASTLTGPVLIPLESIEKVYRTGSVVYVVANKTSYQFMFVKNAEALVGDIEKQLPDTISAEKVHTTEGYARRVLLVFGGIALAIIFYICGQQGVFKSSDSSPSKSWSDLSDVEKENAKWAYEAEKAIDKYGK